MLHELWAGVLIFLSVLAYGFKRPDWGVAAALAALAVRELAAPYCVLCAVLAVVEGRRRGTLMWLLGAVAYGAVYAAHVAAVLPHTTPDAAIQARQWFSFGGAGFRDIGRAGERLSPAVAAMGERQSTWRWPSWDLPAGRPSGAAGPG